MVIAKQISTIEKVFYKSIEEYSEINEYTSIRGRLTHQAIADLNLLRTLEKKIGRERVVELIDSSVGYVISFDNYPREKEFLPALRERIIDLLK